MTKKDRGPGCLMYLFVLFCLGCLAVYFIFLNGFNFKTLIIYGPSQYFANILHFHKDNYYCRAESTLKIYKKHIACGFDWEKLQHKTHYYVEAREKIQAGRL